MTLIEALPAAVVASVDGELHLNAAARHLYGAAANDRLTLESLYATVSARYGDDPVSSDGSPLSRALRGEAVVGAELRVRVRGEDRVWIVDAAPIVDRGHVSGAVSVIRDVTERASEEDMADDLLGRAAHDLRTPLTAIKASAQLIGRGLDRLDEAARARTLSLLLAQVEKLAGKIDDVLDAARIRRGRYDVAPEDIDVGAVLAEVASACASSAGSPRVTLDLAPGLRAHCDRNRLRQMVTRLVLECAERHGLDVDVVVRGRASSAGVEIAVDPQADGAPANETRKPIARKFAKGFLERLGGKVHVDPSRPHATVLVLAPARDR